MNQISKRSYSTASKPSDSSSIIVHLSLSRLGQLRARTNLQKGARVAILGAGGGIGQPLSLLMKLNPYVSTLKLYDIVGTPGVAADLSHINTRAQVSGFKGPEQLAEAVTDVDLVLIPAGLPRKPGMTRDDLFNKNASIVQGLATAVAQNSPRAFLGIIANPVNSTVPICAETYKKLGVYDPKRIFGITTLDILRANTFLSGINGSDPTQMQVNVIGGHSGNTIVPLLSQTGIKLSKEQLDALTHRIQFGGDEVVKAKDGAGSATLSMAKAAERWANSLLEAVYGGKPTSECTFVESPLFASQGIPYFATRVEFGPEGVKKIHDIGKITDFEKALLDKCLPELKGNIQKGVDFVKNGPKL